MLQYIVQVVEHRPGDEPPSDNGVGPLKPKRTQVEAIGYWCRHNFAGPNLGFWDTLGKSRLSEGIQCS